MKEFTKREKIILIVAFVFAAVSIAVMINQINILSQLKNKSASVGETEVTINWYDDTTSALQGVTVTSSAGTTYVINTKSKKIHSPDCQYAQNINEENKSIIVTDDLSEYTDNGYSICSKCGAQ